MPKSYLVTGAGGEIGTSLLKHFTELSDGLSDVTVVAVDLNDLHPDVNQKRVQFYKGSITTPELLETLEKKYQFDEIFHLAGVLSTAGEKNPLLAHQVNVDGTLKLLTLAQKHSEARKSAVKFLFPSTIAVYGLRSTASKELASRVSEESHLEPATMYGNNKLYCERLGEYFSKNYNLLASTPTTKVDFRALRFPGLISVDTLPTGGTSDYGAEMVHAAARGESYECFVRPDTRLPFMVMPDAVTSLLELAAAPRESLRQTSYNVTSFALTAEEIASEVLRFYPKAQITFNPHPQRQYICDTWPGDINDDAAKRDWNWSPAYDLRRSFDEYLMPAIAERYRSVRTANAK